MAYQPKYSDEERSEIRKENAKKLHLRKAAEKERKEKIEDFQSKDEKNDSFQEQEPIKKTETPIIEENKNDFPIEVNERVEAPGSDEVIIEPVPDIRDVTPFTTNPIVRDYTMDIEDGVSNIGQSENSNQQIGDPDEPFRGDIGGKNIEGESQKTDPKNLFDDERIDDDNDKGTPDEERLRKKEAGKTFDFMVRTYNGLWTGWPLTGFITIPKPTDLVEFPQIGQTVDFINFQSITAMQLTKDQTDSIKADAVDVLMTAGVELTPGQRLMIGVARILVEQGHKFVQIRRDIKSIGAEITNELSRIRMDRNSNYQSQNTPMPEPMAQEKPKEETKSEKIAA
tara:strand:+ start:12321 stop:13340 length:1020 start_codon:yes stop_codon:yes gene_type:complete